MSLFTFVLDYCGGTYLSQVESENFVNAPSIWADQLNVNEITEYHELFKKQLLLLQELESPVALNGLVNTWCLTFTILDELAIVHYIQTFE